MWFGSCVGLGCCVVFLLWLWFVVWVAYGLLLFWVGVGVGFVWLFMFGGLVVVVVGWFFGCGVCMV